MSPVSGLLDVEVGNAEKENYSIQAGTGEDLLAYIQSARFTARSIYPGRPQDIDGGDDAGLGL